MTTATDTMTVRAVSKADAPDIARRHWEPLFRVLRVIDVVPGPQEGSWRVTADVEVVRR